MKRGKVGEISGDIIIVGGLLAAGYFVFQHFFGNGDDTVLSDEQAIDPAANPFSYQFQPFVDFFNNNTPSITTGQGFFANIFSDLTMQTGPQQQNDNPTMQQFFQYLKSNPDTPSPWGILNTTDLSARAEHLKAAVDVSPINPLSTSDQAVAMSAFAGLTRQLQIAFIACYFWYNWNLDLLNYLHGSIISPGLTQTNLDNLINNVNAMPV